MVNISESAPETGVVVISRGGADVANRLAAAFSPGPALHVVDRYVDLVSGQCNTPVEGFSLPLRPVIGRLFQEYRRLILVMPVGAAVRLIAPLLQHKYRDPAVVCVDDAGRFAVSLLSGHLGGADELAKGVALALGGTAVITSASHVRNTLAVDLLGREFGWQIEADLATITRVSAAVVNGESVAVWQDAGERDWALADNALPSNLVTCTSAQELARVDCMAALVVSDRRDPLAWESATVELTAPTVVFRPQSLVVGMGCRRGVPVEHLDELLSVTFDEHNLSSKCIKYIATAEIKRDEAGIQQLAEKYGCPVICYGVDELNSVYEAQGGGEPAAGSDECGSTEVVGLVKSQAARRLLGVWGVSEPAALLASGADQLLVSRQKTDRATIAVARIPFDQELYGSNPSRTI